VSLRQQNAAAQQNDHSTENRPFALQGRYKILLLNLATSKFKQNDFQHHSGDIVAFRSFF
jgi:hypothetical protein